MDTSAAAAQALGERVKASERTGVEAMKDMAADQEARAKRLSLIAKRLEAKLGQENPRMASLRQASETSLALAKYLRWTVKGIETFPGPRPEATILTGRVVEATGLAMAGARIFLSSDLAGKEPLSEKVVADEHGGFMIEVKTGPVDPVPEREVYVVMEDSNGLRINDEPAKLRLMSGSISMVNLTRISHSPPGCSGTGRS